MIRLAQRFLIIAMVSTLLGAANAATFQSKQTATLRALDKVTGRSTDIDMVIGEPIVFGSLKVELVACYQTPPEETPESAAFLKIHSTQPVAVADMNSAVSANEVETVNDENPLLFSGWMFASSPGLSALEHQVYDVWVIRCEMPDPSAIVDPEESEDSANEAEPEQ